MPEKIKEIYEKCADTFFGLASKFDGVSEKIFEKTGLKINVGIILMSIVFILLVLFFARLVLKFVLHFLFTGEM